jgi:hypothetical protein
MTDQASSANAASPSSSAGTAPGVLFFSRDIFFAPAVKTAATAAGCQFHILGRIDATLAPEVAQAVRACVVDLTPLDTEQIAQWGRVLSERFPGAKRIAFGPHVQVEHFAAASAAGFDPVMPKGQVAANLGRLLQ